LTFTIRMLFPPHQRKPNAMRTKLALIASLLAGALLLSTTASATLPLQKQYAEYYKGSKPKCATCHTTGPKLNEYGTALQKALKGAKVLTPAMFKACEALNPKA
jgi:hypothetical protein